MKTIREKEQVLKNDMARIIRLQERYEEGKMQLYRLRFKNDIEIMAEYMSRHKDLERLKFEIDWFYKYRDHLIEHYLC